MDQQQLPRNVKRSPNGSNSSTSRANRRVVEGSDLNESSGCVRFGDWGTVFVEGFEVEDDSFANQFFYFGFCICGGDATG